MAILADRHPITIPTTTTSLLESSASGNNHVRVDCPQGRDEVPSAQEYYEAHHHVTRHEYHVVPSTCTPGRYWVMNATDLIVCTHDTEAAANWCAAGTACPRRF
jgi:hypothetical protein